MARTPCIGICSTAIGDEVCRGCKRFAQEVIDWNAYSEAEKLAVLKRLDTLMVQTVQTRFEIFDSRRLLERMRYQQIRIDEQRNPYCWLFELLRVGAGQIDRLADYGVAVKAPWQHDDLTTLKAHIDKDYFERSCAYYQRYILPGQRAAEMAK